MTPEQNLWDEPLLWAKALSYVEIALGKDRHEWQYPFWLTLALEHLARTALSHVHVSLLAAVDRNDDHLLYALNLPTTSPQYSPISIDAFRVFRRCATIFPKFTDDQFKFCVSMSRFRNGELHSGGAPFFKMPIADWQPRYYAACQILLESLEKALEDLLGSEEAARAEYILNQWKDESGKKAQKEVKRFKDIWAKMTPEQQAVRRERSAVWARREEGHVVQCPSCGSDSLVYGQGIAESRMVGGDKVIQIKTDVLPIKFKCIACGLGIIGYNRLLHIGLGQPFTATEKVDPIEYYGFSEFNEPDWEPDFNE